VRRIPEGDNGEDGLVHLVVLDGLSRRLVEGLGEAVVKSPLGVVVHCQGQWKASVAGWGAIVMEIWIGTSSGC
jgi:hypothetical protein